MAADGSPVIPAIRLAAPLVQDYLRLAQIMRPDEIAQYLSVTGQTEYDPDECARRFLSLNGVAHALIDRDGRAILIGGHEEVRPGVWQGWMMGSMDGWGRYGFAICRAARRMQDLLLATDRCHRVQILASPNRKAAHVWYERCLGMSFEGANRKYFADGSDALCFAIVKED